MKATTTTIVRDATTGETVAFSATWDVTPAPGETVRDLDHGVTIVKRDPPRRPGQWCAPYAANCAEHGWIASRSSLAEATEEGRQHIAGQHRTFDDARRRQGFRSQAQLDAHFTYSDHVKACSECGPGPAMWLDGSASWQPTQGLCAEARRLQAASDSFSPYRTAS